MDGGNNLLTADKRHIGKCGLSLGIWAYFIQEKTGFVSTVYNSFFYYLELLKLIYLTKLHKFILISYKTK